MAGVQTQRKGKNYASNVIDTFLMFESDGAWTATTGSGDGVHIDNFSFQGNRSLMLQNNTPNVDLDVTNSVQKTVITQDNKYSLSFMVLKDNEAVEIGGKVSIFQNALLIDTIPFSIGSSVLEDDVDQKWVRFVSDSYSFEKEDEITFTFSIAGNPTNQPYTRLFFDGMFLHKSRDRFNAFSPAYTVPQGLTEVAETTVIKIKNVNGGTITKGQSVRVNGSDSGIPTAVRSLADTTENAISYGIAMEDIPVGSSGNIISLGQISGVNTAAYNEGDLLVVDGSVAGLLTTIPQEILSPVAYVLVSDATDGSIIVNPRGVVNILAVGQVRGLAGSVQNLTTTPQPLMIYDNTPFFKNIDVVQGGASPYTASLSPSVIAATGYYEIVFSVAIESVSNEVLHFEVYTNGVPTGILATIDLSNNTITDGSCAFAGISETKITDSTDVEIYGYTQSGSAIIDVASAIFNIKRLGNI